MTSLRDNEIALSEIEVARRDGKPIYEVQSGGVTLDISPNPSIVKKVVDLTMDCSVYDISPAGTKRLVAFRCRKQMVFNHTNIVFAEVV